MADAPFGYARWLICRNEDASKKIFVATGILVFDFELFVGVRFLCGAVVPNRSENQEGKAGAYDLEKALLITVVFIR